MKKATKKAKAVNPMYRNFDPKDNPSIVAVKKAGKLVEIQITLDPKKHAKVFSSGKKGFYARVAYLKLDGREMFGQVMLYGE